MSNNTVLVTGNTYPVKEQLKQLGARWDGVQKGWRVPADKAAQAQAIVAAAPSSAPRAVGNGAPRRCRECKGPIRNSSHHRAMGGLCGDCAFDEYDC